MWLVFIVIVVAVVVVMKTQNSGGGMPGKADEAIRQSKFAAVFAESVCDLFVEGGEHYQWLMVNSKERFIRMEFSKQGVMFQKVEFNKYRLQETGSYVEDSSGFGFGASGYQDLPNAGYVAAFQRYIFEQMKKNCPHITIYNGNCVKLAESAKKSW